MKHGCCYCNKQFHRKSDLHRHVTTVHFKEKKEICTFCNRTFGLKGTLTKHIQFVHLKEPKRYECEFCRKMFNRNPDLKRHVVTVHFKEKNYSCPHCNKEFGLKGTLTKHIETVHMKEYKFSCQYCLKTFSRKPDMLRHISTIHFKEKDFRCQYCDKSFGLKGTMTQHMSAVHGKDESLSSLGDDSPSPPTMVSIPSMLVKQEADSTMVVTKPSTRRVTMNSTSTQTMPDLTDGSLFPNPLHPLQDISVRQSMPGPSGMNSLSLHNVGTSPAVNLLPRQTIGHTTNGPQLSTNSSTGIVIPGTSSTHQAVSQHLNQQPPVLSPHPFSVTDGVPYPTVPLQLTPLSRVSPP